MRIKLCMTLLLLVFALQAKVVKPVLDNDLSHRYDSNFEETDRAVAGDKPEPVDQVNDDSDWDEKEEIDEDDESARNPSAAGKSFEKENENGIRYWKY